MPAGGAEPVGAACRAIATPRPSGPGCQRAAPTVRKGDLTVTCFLRLSGQPSRGHTGQRPFKDRRPEPSLGAQGL